MSKVGPVAVECIEGRIFLIRGHKVILDADLAGLYGVATGRFNEQVKRNRVRFPRDFMFQLRAAEWTALRSQFATLKVGRGQHRKYLPYVFTEHGAIMAAGILNSPRAIEVSVYVVRAFVRMREVIGSNKELARRIFALEAKMDAKFRIVFEAIRELMTPPEPKKRPIGFVTPLEK